MAMEFDAPIPGQSLTNPPKQYPWERPPETADPKEALRMHMEKLDRPDTMDGILTFLEAGATVKELTMGLLRTAVAEGIHSPDISLMLAPAIHEKIKMAADKVGVEADEGFENEEDNKSAEKIKTLIKARKMLKKGGYDTEDVSFDEPIVEEEPPVEEAPKRGLMARRK